MMKNNIILILGLLISLTSTLYAQQDKHFSMFYTSKVQSNPAAAGFFEGDFQVFTNYRNQWSAISDNPYNTISASFDTRFEIGNGFLGTGINFYNDVSGDSKYKVSQITIPINYAIALTKTNYLSLGISPAFYQRSLSGTNMTWDNQWTGVEFDTNINNGEFIADDNLSVGNFDLSMGLFWQGVFSKYTWVGAGISFQHITKQKINFLNVENVLYKKIMLSAYGNFGQKNSNFTLKPNAMMFVQGPNKMLVIGSGFDFKITGNSLHTDYHKRTSIEFGLYARVMNALIFNTFFHMSGLTVGVSFDINTSTINKTAGGFGAMEFLLSYKFSKSKGLGAPRVH